MLGTKMIIKKYDLRGRIWMHNLSNHMINPSQFLIFILFYFIFWWVRDLFRQMELLNWITKHAEEIASHRTNSSKLTTKITNKKLPIYLNAHELSLVAFTNNIALHMNWVCQSEPYTLFNLMNQCFLIPCIFAKHSIFISCQR